MVKVSYSKRSEGGYFAHISAVSGDVESDHTLTVDRSIAIIGMPWRADNPTRKLTAFGVTRRDAVETLAAEIVLSAASSKTGKTAYLR